LGHHGASNTADLVIAGNHVELTKHDDADAKLSSRLDVKPPQAYEETEEPQRNDWPGPKCAAGKEEEKNITSPIATTRSRQQASC
jgi:hypothetical protein